MNEEAVASSSQCFVREFVLKEGNELRFEVDGGSDVLMELIDGSGEIFGTELIQNKKYIFPPYSRAAVFTWWSATVKFVGKLRTAYLAEQTPMIFYLNTHVAIDKLREYAESDVSGGTKGPVLMIVGPTDVGKSTLCRILCNYAIRDGRELTFVDLDLGQGSISVPGTIGAIHIQKTADVISGFENKCPLILQFGRPSPSSNVAFYDLLIEKLANTISEKIKMNVKMNCGGVIINTSGWVKDQGYASLVHAAEHFEPDIIIVLNCERLYNNLQRDLPPFIKILHQPKSGGVKFRSRETRIASRNSVVYKYFYGTPSHPLNPSTTELAFNEIEIYKICDEKLFNDYSLSELEIKERKLKVDHVEPSESLRNHMVALIEKTQVDQSILTSAVLEFLVITEVNTERRMFTVLKTNPYPLRARVLVLSEITLFL